MTIIEEMINIPRMDNQIKNNFMNTLVIGASANKERYSYKAISFLRARQHQVFAIGLREEVVLDVSIQTGFPAFENIHTVTLYLNSQRQKDYYDYIINLKPKRIIFNPGAENVEFQKLAASHNIETMNSCTLVMLSTGQY